MIRVATEADIDAIVKIYEAILTREEAGLASVGWIRDVYPTRETAMAAIRNLTMYVLEDQGQVVAAAKIDQNQGAEYQDANWEYEADDDDVMVLHTLVVDPELPRRGYGKAFVQFYEQLAVDHDCPYLRMDTNEKNANARAIYHKLGYNEADIVPCEFNGIPGVRLVCLEKKLKR